MSWVWEGLGAPGGKTVLGACGGTASQHSYAYKFQLGKPQASLYPASLRLIFPLFPWAGSRPGSLPRHAGPSQGSTLAFSLLGGWGWLEHPYSGDVPGPLSYTPK